MQGRHRQDLHQQPVGTGVLAIQPHNLDVLVRHQTKDFDDRLARQRLFGITTGRCTIVREIGGNVEIRLGVFRLLALTVVALLLVAQQFVQRIEAAFAVADLDALLEFELVRQHAHAAAVKADAPQHLQRDVEKALVVHRLGQFEVTEIARIGFVVQVSETRIIDAA